MKRTVLRSLKVPIQLTVLLVGALLFFPHHAGLALHIYVVLIAAYALGRLVRAVRAAYPRQRRSAFDLALKRPVRAPLRPEELERLEREVSLGTATAFDFHYRLRPTLRGIAAELLAARRGIDLEASPEAARRALGDEAWELVRSDREPPEKRFGAGVDAASLRNVVTALESI